MTGILGPTASKLLGSARAAELETHFQRTLRVELARLDAQADQHRAEIAELTQRLDEIERGAS